MKKTIPFLFSLIFLAMICSCQKEKSGKEGKRSNQDTTVTAEKTSVLDKDSLPSPDEFVPWDVEPKPIKKVEPVYPDSAKKTGIEGVVWVQALIDKNGKVRQARCLRELSKNPDIFCEPATQAALQYEYEPALIAKKPVAVWVQYKVTFILK